MVVETVIEGKLESRQVLKVGDYIVRGPAHLYGQEKEKFEQRYNVDMAF